MSMRSAASWTHPRAEMTVPRGARMVRDEDMKHSKNISEQIYDKKGETALCNFALIY
jgi:hypothetical protein